MNNSIAENISNLEINIRRINPDYSIDFLDLFYEYIKLRLFQDDSISFKKLINNKEFKEIVQKSIIGNRINDITIEGGNITIPEGMIL